MCVVMCDVCGVVVVVIGENEKKRSPWRKKRRSTRVCGMMDSGLRSSVDCTQALVYFFALPHPTTTSALHDTLDTGLAASDARTDLSTLAFLPPTQTLTTSSLPPPKPRRVYQLPASH